MVVNTQQEKTFLSIEIYCSLCKSHKLCKIYLIFERDLKLIEFGTRLHLCLINYLLLLRNRNLRRFFYINIEKKIIFHPSLF